MNEIHKRELRNLQNDLELLVNEWKIAIPGQDDYYAAETVTTLRRIISIHQTETEKLTRENLQLRLTLKKHGINESVKTTPPCS